MNPIWKSWTRALPRSWRQQVRRWRHGAVYRGDFATWAEARAASRGYDDPALMEKTIAAARAVRDGLAAWERDTVLFSEPAANGPLLEALRGIAAAEGGRLRLIDFGGALGSAWWQHRPWLEALSEVRWAVVEQPALVAAGREEFTRGPLTFHPSITDAQRTAEASVVLFSSVLPYLEEPYAILDAARALPVRHVIVDRTGTVERGRDRLTVQQVPREIYDASYPCWFLDRERLLSGFRTPWRLRAEWRTDDVVDIAAEHRGFWFDRGRI
jgi:putative methyltransferase (TIGR04325 family)